MIAFDLICDANHRFEGWFRSSAVFDEQQAQGQLSCPICGSNDVRKAPMAPAIVPGRSQERSLDQLVEHEAVSAHTVEAAFNADLPPKLKEEVERVFAKVRAHVEDTCDYVGEDFAEEARAIHYGDVDPRGIYGEASDEEAQDLLDEGIELMALPFARKSDA